MADQTIPKEDLRKPGGVGQNEPKPKPAPKASPNPPVEKPGAAEQAVTSAAVGGFSHINKHILVATVGLVAIGLVRTWNKPNASMSRVFSGGFLFLLSMSVLDLFGGGASKLASALAMLALVSGIITIIPANFIASLANTKGA